MNRRVFGPETTAFGQSQLTTWQLPLTRARRRCYANAPVLVRAGRVSDQAELLVLAWGPRVFPELTRPVTLGVPTEEHAVAAIQTSFRLGELHRRSSV